VRGWGGGLGGGYMLDSCGQCVSVEGTHLELCKWSINISFFS
jgi:hypothetical protein